MISIIVCSVNEAFLKQLKSSIAGTIGCDYEVLVRDNRASKDGISKVYNELASKAKFDLLCFLHEDVQIHTPDWGVVLCKLLSDSKIGLVGISGSVYKSAYPATWPACDQSLYRTHSIQHFKNSTIPVISNYNPLNEDASEVAVVDGVFLATRKDVFYNFKFDEQTFQGFHAYDLDYSLQIGTLYKVVVSFNITLEHFSEGSLNRQWFTDSFLLHKKWRSTLPKKVGAVTTKQQKFSDYISCQSVLHQVLKQKLGRRKAVYYFYVLVTRFSQYNGLKYGKAVLLNLIYA